MIHYTESCQKQWLEKANLVLLYCSISCCPHILMNIKVEKLREDVTSETQWLLET